MTFKEGSSILGSSQVNVSGTATLTINTLNPGNHAISAVYSGDTNYLPSTSGTVPESVTLAVPTVILSGPAGAVDAGTGAQFQVVIASSGTAPTGTLTLLDSSASIGTVTLSNAGTFTFTSAQLAVGVHHLTASYSGDNNNAAVTSTAITITVQQSVTVTALSSSSNPLTHGSALTLTATVTSDSPNPGNQVSFFDDTVLLGSVPLGTNGTATLSVQNLEPGSHNIKAIYSGDTSHTGSASPLLPELVVQASSLSLGSSVNPSISGHPVSLSAQMLGSPTPTGSVVFRDNGVPLATVSLSGTGLATFSSSSLAVGDHTITATYSGDANFASAGAQISQTVLKASTQTTVSVNANPASYGQPATLLATVSTNGAADTGTVIFTDNGVPIGSAPLDSDGHAILTVSNLTPGIHSIAANYSGDGENSSSSSSALGLTVKQTTAVALSSNANPAQTLTALYLVAALTSAGPVTPTGTVRFTDGSTLLGSSALDSTGHAALSIPQLTAGIHTVIAGYSGDAVDLPSQSAAFSQDVRLRPTTTTITGASTDAANPQQITLIAVIQGSGAVPPSGLVTFTSGNITLGAASVDSTGVATDTVVFTSSTEQITATYAGDISYAGSQSSASSITAGTPAQFTLALSQAAITLQTHQNTTLSVRLTSVKGFTDNIELGCLGLPYAATCTFDQTQLKLAPDGTATAALVLDTGNPLGAGSSATALAYRPPRTFLCLLPACLLLGSLIRFPRSRRSTHLRLLLVALSAVALTGALTGCSGLQMSGTPPGTYNIRIVGTGQGSNATESQPFTLVVTQ